MLIINRGNLFPSKTKTQLTSEAILHPQGRARFARWALANVVLESRFLNSQNANLHFSFRSICVQQHHFKKSENSECSFNNYVHMCLDHISLLFIFLNCQLKLNLCPPPFLRLSDRMFLLHVWKQWLLKPAFICSWCMQAEGPMTLTASYHGVFEWHFSGLKLETRFNVRPPSRSQNNPGKRM